MFKEGLNVSSFSRDIHRVYFLVLLVQSYFDENGIEKFGFDADEYNFNKELPQKPQPLPLQIEDGYDENEYGSKRRINNRKNRRLERRNRRLDRRNRKLDRKNRRLGRRKRDLGDKNYYRWIICNSICKKDNDWWLLINYIGQKIIFPQFTKENK